MRILLALLALFIAGFAADTARAGANDIQMLPPTGFALNAPKCGSPGAGVGVLYWDGVTPIHCIPGFYGDPTGNVSVGNGGSTGALTTFNSLYSNGSLYLDGVGPLNAAHATALQQLVGASCVANGANYQVLTRVNGVIQCANVTDIIGANGPMGQTWLSACPAGTVLTSLDGANFTCVGLSVASCPPGEVLAGMTNGSHICVQSACPAGQALQVIGSSGVQCVVVPPAAPAFPDCGGTPSTISIVSDDGHNANYQCNPICPAGSATYAVANGSYYFGVNQEVLTLNYPTATAIGQVEPPGAVTWQGTTYGGPSFSDGCGSVWYIQCTATGWKTVPSPSSAPNEFCPSSGPGPDGGPG